MSFYGTPRKRTIPKEVPIRQITVGSSIQASCRKCKATTEHTVVAKIGVKPSRVACSRCKDEHDYSVAKPRAKADPTMSALPWADALRAATGIAKPYSVGGSYGIGARVQHTTFGEGVVVRHSSSTVCEVLFEERTVKLLMAPTAAGYDGPAPSPSRAVGARRRRFA
ncbi:MAG TPA: hypothetical protein VIS07_18105 [Candidatus Binatia bacterium]